MLRTALFIAGLVSLLASAAVAAPTKATLAEWRGWGFRHRRPSQASFVPVYATYRYHSRERHGLFGFLKAPPLPGTWARASTPLAILRAQPRASTQRAGFNAGRGVASIAELTS